MPSDQPLSTAAADPVQASAGTATILADLERDGLAPHLRLRPDVVLVAAGYERGLEPLLGELGVLRPDGRPTVSGATSPTGAPGL